MSRPKAGTYCCVVKCPNNNINRKDLTFYSFSVKPHKREQAEKWIAAVKRVNPDGSSWRPSKYARICSEHFIGNKKSDCSLSPSFLPTIFPKEYLKSTPSECFKNSTTNRFERSLVKHVESSGKSLAKRRKTETKTPQENENSERSVAHQGMDEVELEKTMKEQGTQVDFFYEELSENCNVFICNTYVDTKTCDVQTQANFKTDVFEKSFKKIKTKDANCGTNFTYDDKCVGPEPYSKKRNVLSQCKDGFHGIESLSDDDINNIAGVRMQVFQLLLKFVVNVGNEKLSRENRLLLFLMKMKLGLTSAALGVLFNVHRTTASRNFKSILESLSIQCKHLISWPSKETILELMPDAFKEKYDNCRIIIDCTEIPVEQPPEISQRIFFYSHYKKGFTIKFLVGCTPSGYISLLSKSYGGRATDAQITNESNFLHLLEPGDMVMADKGFPAIQTKLDALGKGIVLVMPPFLRQEYFTADEVTETQEIASVRIHIERIMQRIKTFNILNKITINMLPYIDAIIFMSAVLVNLQPPIIKQ